MTQQQTQGFNVSTIARIFDVPPWMVDPTRPIPRLARMRWMLRRVFPALVWKAH